MRTKKTKKTECVISRERERREVGLSELHGAPWNARPEISAESVADLANSIRSLGLIQPLVVMEREGGGYIIIAGHRRAAACEAAGLETVPVDVMLGVSEADARRMTFIENLQRADVDPLMESDLVAQLLADGMTQAEIVAETGRGERWVARRANLRELVLEWRSTAEKYRITVDALEHIAAYPADVQRKALDQCHFYDDGGIRSWSSFVHVFRRVSRDLNSASFSRRDCTNCASNTACCPSLFADEDDEKQKYGLCLNAECFAARCREYVEKAERKAKKCGHEIRRPKGGRYDVEQYWTMQKKPDEEHTVFCVWESDGVPDCGWVIPCRAVEWNKSPEEEEAVRAERAKKKKRDKALRAVAVWCTENDRLAGVLEELARTHAVCGDDLWVPMLLVSAIGAGTEMPGYSRVGIMQRFAVAVLSGGRVGIDYARWAKAAADDMIVRMDPKVYGGYYAVPVARLVFALTSEIRHELPEEFEELLPGDELEKMRSPDSGDDEEDCDEE